MIFGISQAVMNSLGYVLRGDVEEINLSPILNLHVSTLSDLL